MTNDHDSQQPSNPAPHPAGHAHDQQHSQPPGEPGSGGGRRRRRRGGRGRGRRDGAPGEQGQTNDPGAPASQQASGDHPPAPGPRSDGAGEPGGDGSGGGRRRRRRRGRGRGDGHSNGPPGHHDQHGQAQHRPQRDDADTNDDDGDEESSAPVRQRQRPPADAAKVANWEEIFQSQTFADLGLRSSVLKGVEAAGFTRPTKIQAELIPLVMAGRDVLGQSRTGTGKTAAFGLPLYHLATRALPFQSLILAPTRELAVQIAAELADLGRFTPIRVSAVYGGQNVGAQARELGHGPEIIVATPGRLMDMVERGHLHLNNVKFAVLDEVDRMLDIGFRDDIKRILSSLKSAHQTVFVSATISEEIEKLARTYMKDPAKLVTTGGSLTVSLVEQHYISVQPWDKRKLLLHVLTHEEPDLTIVFCRTKRTVDELAKYLHDKGIDAHAIHGDMYQGKRNSVMKRLREGELGVLVASDLASRGLDVDGISHVVNYDLPEDPEVYIHRIGRTARAGRGGVAWSLVTPEQGELLTAIENLANTHIPEKTYPDFKPGQLPSDVIARRNADAMRVEQKRSVSRLGPSAPPPGAAAREAPASTPGGAPAPRPVVAVDPSKFPGGLVPTKLPPRMMGGRVKSARAIRAAAAAPAPAPDAPPPANPTN